MSTATLAPPRSETYRRAALAKRLSEVLAWHMDDARVAEDYDWISALPFAYFPGVTGNNLTPEVKASVMALMDVADKRYRVNQKDAPGREKVAYFVARKAMLIVLAFKAANLPDGVEPTDEQWELANQISAKMAGVRPTNLSPTIREAVAALRETPSVE